MMNMHKVKYTRKEYREEYLNSQEWKDLRKTIMFSKPDCQCCLEKPALDVHHMVYRNIVDILYTDLLPVCRTCHELIHEAINHGFIQKNPEKIDLIIKETKNIFKNEEFKGFLKWLNSKHYLTEEEIKQISIDKVGGFCIKRICGLLKKNVKYVDLPEIKFTGRQILKIRDFIKVSAFRSLNKTKSSPIKYKRISTPKDDRKIWTAEKRLKKR